MAHNPFYNPDQFAAEDAVIAMWREDCVKQAREKAAMLFDLAYGVDTPSEAKPTFENAMDEFVTNYLFKAAASDPVHPRFVRDFMPAYQWRGVDVPGARMGGDNPDNIYLLAGIAHGGRYKVTAKLTGPEPANTSFTLTGNFGTSVTIHTIESGQLKRDQDGGFEITIDSEAANGRSNHLTTAKHVKFLYIRISLNDWAVECPYELNIERLDAVVDSDPLTVEKMAREGAFRLIEDIPLYYWFHRLFSGLGKNTLCPPKLSGDVGGLVSQAGAQGFFSLDDDECVVIRYKAVSAPYAAVQLADWWFRSIDAHRRPSSLTEAQSHVDADGWIRLVASKQDPGVANWLDTGGLNTFLLLVRWQGLSPERSGDGPVCETDVVKLDDVQKLCPEGPLVDAKTRAEQIKQRVAAWNRRIAVN